MGVCGLPRCLLGEPEHPGLVSGPGASEVGGGGLGLPPCPSAPQDSSAALAWIPTRPRLLTAARIIPGACGHDSRLGPVHVISSSQQEAHTFRLHGRGTRLIISHAAGVPGSGEGCMVALKLRYSCSACGPPVILRVVVSLHGPNLPPGRPRTPAMHWFCLGNAHPPRAVLRSGRLLERGFCTLQRDRLCFLFCPGLRQHQQAFEGCWVCPQPSERPFPL